MKLFRYVGLILLLCLTQNTWADVVLKGTMNIGDNNDNYLNPTKLISRSNGVYIPVHPIHFSLSQATSITKIGLGSGQNALYPVNFIVWDKGGNIKIPLAQANSDNYTLTGIWSLPAGDYEIAVFGQCAVRVSNTTTENKSYDQNCGGSVSYNNYIYSSDWDDFSFSDITLYGAESSAVSFIQRQHIGDNTNATRWYPPSASGASTTYSSFTISTPSTLNSVTLYNLIDWSVTNDSKITLYKDSMEMWSNYLTSSDSDNNLAFTPNIYLSTGNYTLKVTTDLTWRADADDISWDDIVLDITSNTLTGLCQSVFPYVIQGRGDTDYVNLSSSSGYIGPRVYGTTLGKLGYQTSTQIRNPGVIVNHDSVIDGNCDNRKCVPSGNNGGALDVDSSIFPLTSNMPNLSVGWLDSKNFTARDDTIFNSISIGSSASATFTGTRVKIKNLYADYASTLTLKSGEYWIETLTLNSNVNLVVDGSVVLHVKNMSVGYLDRINSRDNFNAGSSAKLFIVVHDSLSVNSWSTLSAFIYQTSNASGHIDLGYQSYLFGRINAKKVELNHTMIDGNVSACPEYSQSSTNHYELQYSSNNLTCEPASITLNACADSATPCTVNSAATDSVTLTAANSIWSANPVTLSGGTAKLTLSHYIAENVKLAIGSGTLVCLKDNSLDSTCQLPFVSSAFSFNIPTFYAGRNSGNVAFKAVQASTTNPAVCTPLFAGKTQSINFTNQFVLPTTAGSESPKLNNVAITTNTSVPLTFDSNGAANIVMTYNDAGVLGISAAYSKTDASAGTLSIAGSDNVAVLPDNIKLTAVGQTACKKVDDTVTTDNKNKAYAACDAYKKAGETFTLSAQAGYSSGSTLISTNNFTPQSTVAKPSLQHALLAPSTGTLSSAWSKTALTFASGTASSTVTEGDVGVYQYQVTPFVPYPSYQDEPTPLTVPESSANWNDPVGRITPAKLQATITAHGALTTDTCVTTATASLGYTGQSLRFAISPTLSVTALGSDGVTIMKNYQNYFAKITSTDAASSGDFIAALVPKNAVNSLTSVASWAAGAWSMPINAYTPVYTFSASDQFTFNKTSAPVSPFETGLTVSTLADSDKISAATSLPLTFYPTSSSGAVFNVYSGRLMLDNVNAAETSTLTLPFYMQYWNGSAYVLNTADNCSSLNATYLTMNGGSNWSAINLRTNNNVAISAITNATLSPAAVTQGAGAIVFSAPNSVGWVDLNASSTLPLWMQDLSLASGLAPARANFGFYRGNDRIIYRREVFGGQ